MLRTALLILLSTFLGACALFQPPPPGIGKTVTWDQVEGWNLDDQSEAWPALMQSCQRLGNRTDWQPLCKAAEALPSPDNESARLFFETWFTPHQVHGARRNSEGLITGYYEPLLEGSLEPSEVYRYPLYERPDELLIVDLGDRFPSLKGERIRGRLEGCLLYTSDAADDLLQV